MRIGMPNAPKEIDRKDDDDEHNATNNKYSRQPLPPQIQWLLETPHSTPFTAMTGTNYITLHSPACDPFVLPIVGVLSEFPCSSSN